MENHAKEASLSISYEIAHFLRLRLEGKTSVLCVETGAIYTCSEICEAVFDAFESKRTLSFSELLEKIEGKWPAGEIGQCIQELIDAKIVLSSETGVTRPAALETPADQPISTLVCILSKHCNLQCSYCYAGQGAYKRGRGLLSRKTAFKAIDFLIGHSGGNREISLVFFGGEPLMNFPVMRDMVNYGREKATETGKRINFSLTTNATMLSPEIIDFLNRESVGITVSMDGGKEIHDSARKFPDGRGSYQEVSRNVQRLLGAYGGRPVGARATITRQAAGDLKKIYSDLIGIGFHQVGLSPVSSMDPSLSLNEDDLRTFTEGFRELAEIYVRQAADNVYPRFSNLSTSLRFVHEGIGKTHPCGAGIGLIGMDADGEFYACHRLIGVEECHLGDLEHGIDKEKQERFVGRTRLENKVGCRGCWARRLCGGGCHYEAILNSGTIAEPPDHYCRWLREWFEIVIGAYIRIRDRNPDFINTVVDKRLSC